MKQNDEGPCNWPDVLAERAFDLGSPYFETEVQAFASRVRDDMRKYGIRAVLPLTFTEGTTFSVTLIPCQVDDDVSVLDEAQLSSCFERFVTRPPRHEARTRVLSMLAQTDAEPPCDELAARARLQAMGWRAP